MKVTEHIEYLLRQGRKPKELLALGFPKQTVTRVRRQIEQGKTAKKGGIQRSKSIDGNHTQQSPSSNEEVTSESHRLEAVERYLKELKGRVEPLEAVIVKFSSLEDIQARLNGTPALDLKHRFKCNCGALGFVAIHIQCTKCGSETWWGWFPK